MTKTQARTLARRSTRYGYFQTTSTTVTTRCPVCGGEVHTEHYAWDKPTERVKKLQSAVEEHVLGEWCIS